jgi:pimeloyl-ACP methyl ester carboxylesterase
MSNGEVLLRANGVELCVEAFGEASDPAVLLVHGASASMLWWEEELCRRIAQGGRYVVRFDNRDTGRSVSYPAGQPGYAMRDLAGDAVGILDALGIRQAHLVGRSMAGGIVTVAAWCHPERVASLTLISTTPGGPDLPPMTADIKPMDTTDVVAYVVGLIRAYSGGQFDEQATEALVRADIARTRDIGACLVNHFVIEYGGPDSHRFGDLAMPVLVVHGDRDPVFPLPHAEAMRDAVPGARLLVLPDTGHELPPRTWDVFVAALLEHTAAATVGE